MEKNNYSPVQQMQVITENRTVQLGCEEGRGGIQMIFQTPCHLTLQLGSSSIGHISHVYMLRI